MTRILVCNFIYDTSRAFALSLTAMLFLIFMARFFSNTHG